MNNLIDKVLILKDDLEKYKNEYKLFQNYWLTMLLKILIKKYEI